jgi:hypothetical protein
LVLTEDRLNSILKAQLTPSERADGIAYAFVGPIPAGAKLRFPDVKLEVPWDALLAFIDQKPRANWGHSCRYILISRKSGEVRSTEARFPPFRQEELHRWRVVYQAPGVPDTLLAVPKN